MTMVVWPHRAASQFQSRRSQNMSNAGTSATSYRIVMAGGGTGGHLYPGLAVADALEAHIRARGGKLELVWAATPRAVDQRLLSKFGDLYIRQPVQPLVKEFGKLWGFWTGWRESCRFWETYFREHRVQAVVALGGYAAGPAAYVAAKRRIPVVLLNPDALPGRANRFLLKRADVVVTQWPLAKEYQAGIRGKVMPLGCPIRPELVATTREEGGKKLGIDPSRKSLVVTGASLGAKTINDAVIELLGDPKVRKHFEDRWQIVHLSGVDQAAMVREAYSKLPGIHVKVIDYCDDMASLWALADLAIARAGASTCAELSACGVPSLLLPYPYHTDMHQRANANELEKVGGALIIDDAKDAKLNAKAIKTPLESLLYDDAKRAKMAANARAAGKPAAAESIAHEILGLIASS